MVKTIANNGEAPGQILAAPPPAKLGLGGQVSIIGIG